MRARLQNGYWPFQAPIGYRYERSSGGHGKILVRDEPNASILQEALEGYASGHFQTQVEVKRFLERQPAFPKDLNGCEVRNQRVYELLTRPLYAGYVEHADWGVSLRKGHHEGLIDFATFQKVQERLSATAKAPARKDISADFPLRGFVMCDDCGQALTACWSTSKTGKKHPYYLCKTKGCESYRKSIKRGQLEEDFEGLLQSLEPSKGLFALAKAMFRDIWNMRLAQAADASKGLKRDIHKIEKQIEALLDRIVESGTASVISAYEKRISKLEAEKILLVERMANSGKPLRTLEESFELALGFLSSPWNIWKNSSLASQKTVLRLAFAEPIRYCRNQGVRTPTISFPFKVLEGISTAKSGMAHLDGESSNALFEALEEWERHLASIDFDSLRCGDEHLRQ